MSNRASARQRSRRSRLGGGTLKVFPIAFTLVAPPIAMMAPGWAYGDTGTVSTTPSSTPRSTTLSLTAAGPGTPPPPAPTGGSDTSTVPGAGGPVVGVGGSTTTTGPPSTDPTGSADPTGVSVPTGSADPAGVSASTGSADPAGVSVPTGSGDPSGSGDPAGVSVPSGSGGPAATVAPGPAQRKPSVAAPQVAGPAVKSTPVVVRHPAPKPVAKPSTATTRPAEPATGGAPVPAGDDTTFPAAASAQPNGYWLLTANGGVFTHGSLSFYGAASPSSPLSDAVALVPTTDGGGYWMATAKGQVYTYGDAQSFGTLDPSALGAPVRTLVPTPDGMGYWLVTSVGGVFSFGDAPFFGAGPADRPLTDVMGMAATPDGQGYWLATSSGQVIAFGDARSYGNGDPAVLGSPVVSFVPTADGLGYWLATANGGVFSFGDATFYGSQWTPGSHDPVVSLTPTADGAGYWITTASGAVTAYGDAGVFPGTAPDPISAAAVGLAVPRGGPLANVPVAYISVEHQAAATCTGLSWTVLAGIAKVESDFGRSTLPGVTSGANHAGAAGPMQIGIGGAAGLTFAAYDHPVPADEASTPTAGALPSNPYDLVDATFAAARDLCSNGAGDPATLRDAVLAYNHSASYADQVLSLADLYGAGAQSSSVAVRVAMTQLGVQYVWGGITPNQGFDCSGLVQWAYRTVGVDLPRTSQEQWLAVSHLPAGSPLQPGDLLFFGPADGPTHVGMYVGGGLMIDAPHTGAVVRIEPYDWSDFLGAGRP